MNGGPEADRLRIGTAEREVTSRLLADHFAEGRLTAPEYEERVDRVLTARTRGDIRPLFSDLPAPHPAFLGSAPQMETRPAVPPTTEVETAEASPHSAVVAGILQIALPFGVGRFYTRDTRLAVLQLLSIAVFGLGAVWCFVDGVILLVSGGTDGKGRRLQ